MGRLAARAADRDPSANRLQVGSQFGLVRGHRRAVQAGPAVERGRHGLQRRVASRQLAAGRHRERRDVTHGVRVLQEEVGDTLRADRAQARNRAMPAQASRADQREQLGEGRDAGGRDQFRVEPAVEWVLGLRRLDEARLMRASAASCCSRRRRSRATLRSSADNETGG